ncbi:MAG: Hsp70 family protein, partial [Bacteroidales bacterium]|nr:Hsp70 family protein [Bacteroidales bacterium]
MAKEIVAISCDLGSTQSEVCVIENGKPVVVVNREGSQMTPSVVSLKDGERKVGAAAKRQMMVNPKETVNIIKRFMGCTYKETEEARKHVLYDVVDVDGQPRVKIGEKLYSPEEISSMILHDLKKSAEDYLGKEVTHAVITVPAYFSNAAREATKKAGELAGLEVMRIIAEPTAAILASNIDMKKGGKYMVVDYGGATIDFSVADIENDVVEILATNGDTFTGGRDLDILISNWLVDEFKSENGIDLSKDPQAMSRIITDAEKAKIELSSSSQTEINIPYITIDKDNQPLHLVNTLTKAKFEQLITSVADKLIGYAKEAMKAAGNPKLDGILLVGGSCRIPLVQERLKKEFGVELIKSSNLDLAVAEGAAIQANTLAGGEGGSELLLLDVIPMNYGITTEGGLATTIIEANTTIPCKRSQIFTTAVDNQPAVDIEVLNGLRPMARDNKVVGKFTLDGIPL